MLAGRDDVREQQMFGGIALYVAPAGVADEADLTRWVSAAATFAESQPPKKRR